MKLSARINNVNELKQEIRLLEAKKLRLESDFKEGFENLSYQLKPINLLKNTVSKLPQLFSFQNNLLGYALGLGAGILSKKLLLGRSPGFLKKSLGAAVELGIAKLVSNRVDKIRTKEHTTP